MRVIIHNHHTKLTPALTAYLEEKLGKLEELLGKSHREHEVDVHAHDCGRYEGKEMFKIGATIFFQGKKIFTEEQGHDLYAVIDKIQSELRRLLTKQKERPLSLIRRGAWRVKNILFRQNPDESSGVKQP
jgi:putative sigma-54 modulation protein